MPAYISAMQAAKPGGTAQLQKHAAVAEAAQPAFFTAIFTLL